MAFDTPDEPSSPIRVDFAGSERLLRLLAQLGPLRSAKRRNFRNSFPLADDEVFENIVPMQIEFRGIGVDLTILGPNGSRKIRALMLRRLCPSSEGASLSREMLSSSAMLFPHLRAPESSSCKRSRTRGDRMPARCAFDDLGGRMPSQLRAPNGKG